MRALRGVCLALPGSRACRHALRPICTAPMTDASSSAVVPRRGRAARWVLAALVFTALVAGLLERETLGEAEILAVTGLPPAPPLEGRPLALLDERPMA